MKKSLLFVISTLRMGGAEKALVSLLNSLDNELVNVDLLVFEDSGILNKSVPDWVNVLKVDDVIRAMTLEARRYLISILKQGKLGAVLSRVLISVLKKLKMHVFSWSIIKKHIPPLRKHYDVSIGFLEDFSNYYVLDKTNADTKIGWIHIDLTNKKMSKEEIQYYNRFDKIATISDICLDAACKAIPGIEEKISVIENIVSKKEVLEKASEPTDKTWDTNCFNILTVGRLEYQKGIDIAAKAAKILKDRGEVFKWHVFGVGNMEESIIEYINQNNIVDCFKLDGLMPNPYPYMKLANLIVQPSRWEGKSIVLDEAKILGKAIVVTDYPSVGDQIKNQETGIIVKIDPDSIATGIEYLIHNPNYVQRLEYNCKNEDDHLEAILEKFYKLCGIV